MFHCQNKLYSLFTVYALRFTPMLITHGTLITMTEPNRVIEDGAVYIRDGLIADLGTTQDLLSRYGREETEILDCRSAIGNPKLILPGNICAHTHFYGAFARGMAIPGSPASDFVQILEKLWWKLDRALDMDGVRYSALVCLVDAIRHGTTTLIDHHASPSAIDGSLDAIADAVEQAGLRASLCYEVTDRNGPEGARAGIAENARFARACAGRQTLNVKAAFGIHALLTAGDDTLDHCVGVAHDAGIPLHLHVAEGQADQAHSLERYGMRVTERLAAHSGLIERTICAHCIHVNEHEVALLAERGAKVTHQPRSNMNNAVGVAPVQAMLAAGICVGLGNDGFSNNAFIEMKFADLLHRHAQGDPRAMGADRVVHMTYANNARIARLLWDRPVGTIEVGAHADLILADYRPFTDLHAGNVPWHVLFGMDGSEVTHTICAGKLLMKDRQLLTLDEAEITAHAHEAARRAWARVETL
jgi:putative selenium metabolism protein SsnA